jgi:hypothetical protein
LKFIIILTLTPKKVKKGLKPLYISLSALKREIPSDFLILPKIISTIS